MATATDQQPTKSTTRTALQWQWLRALHDDPKMSASAFSIGFGICRSINGKTGFAFPGQARLGEWAGLGERQARGLIRQLESAGYLTIQSGGFQKPDRYWITLPDRKSTSALRPEIHCRSDDAPDRKSSVAVTGTPLPPNCSSELFEKKEKEDPPRAPSPSETARERIQAVEIAKTRRGSRSRLPIDWEPPADAYDFGAELGFTADQVAFETAKFRDHAAANDRLQVDWTGAWRNWLRKAVEFRAQRRQPQQRQSAVDWAVARFGDEDL